MGLEVPLGTFCPRHPTHSMTNLCARNLSTKLLAGQNTSHRPFPPAQLPFLIPMIKDFTKNNRGGKVRFSSQSESSPPHGEESSLKLRTLTHIQADQEVGVGEGWCSADSRFIQ